MAVPYDSTSISAEETMSLENFMILARRYLANEDVWDDDVFLPVNGSKSHRDAYRKLYTRYFNQILKTHGFDIDFYPGNARAAIFIPYLDFEKEMDMLMELANCAIGEYNMKASSVFKYEIMEIEKVNFVRVEGWRKFFMTVIVQNLTLHTAEETFQIYAQKGPEGETMLGSCGKKKFPI